MQLNRNHLIVFLSPVVVALLWQWPQPPFNLSYYANLAIQQRRRGRIPNRGTNTLAAERGTLNYNRTHLTVDTIDLPQQELEQMQDPLQGVVIVITGCTSGLGLGFAKIVYQMGATVIAIGRSPSKLAALKDYLLQGDRKNRTSHISDGRTEGQSRICTIQADFQDLQSVSNAAKEIQQKFTSVDFLINNAGMYHATTHERATVQGYDIVFGVNYLSHFLLTHQLLPLLQKSTMMKEDGGARIIQVSSVMHGGVDGWDLLPVHHQYRINTDRTYTNDTHNSTHRYPLHQDRPTASEPFDTMSHKERSYSLSKLAQIYHARSLTSKLLQQSLPSSSSLVRIVSVCPSWVGTSIGGSGGYQEYIMKHLGYESDGYGVSSILFSMFHPDAGQDRGMNDFVSNNRNFNKIVRFASRWLGYFPWMDRSNVRLVLWWFVALVLLLVEKVIPDTVGFVDSSEESYDVIKQDILYQWSMEAIIPYL